MIILSERNDFAKLKRLSDGEIYAELKDGVDCVLFECDEPLFCNGTKRIPPLYRAACFVGYNAFEWRDRAGNPVLSVTVLRLPGEALFGKEKYRPSLHNTVRFSLLNDPNGPFYNADTDEYHLYFQFQANTKKGKEMKTWAHAVSKDLVKWHRERDALEPDELGEIYSGSCVIDDGNTSALFGESVPERSRIVAFYTSFDGTEKQSLAYSKDGGYTFQKYKKNPVIANGTAEKPLYTQGFRDPKVIKYENGNEKKWIMVLAGHTAKIYSSDNLIVWKYESEIKTLSGETVICECPDLFPVAFGKTTKYLFVGSDYNDGDSKIFYLAGDLLRRNGKFEFVSETDPMTDLSYNPETYAPQTFYNDKFGRRLSVSWIRDWFLTGEMWKFAKTDADSKYWLGTHTFVQELSLKTLCGNRYKLYARPVRETEGYFPTEVYSLRNSYLPADTPLPCRMGKRFKIAAVFDAEKTQQPPFFLDFLKHDGKFTRIGIDLADSVATFDKRNSGRIVTGKEEITVPFFPSSELGVEIYFDVSVIELYINNGERNVTTQIYPDEFEFTVSFAEVTSGVFVKELTVRVG